MRRGARAAQRRGDVSICAGTVRAPASANAAADRFKLRLIERAQADLRRCLPRKSWCGPLRATTSASASSPPKSSAKLDRSPRGQRSSAANRHRSGRGHVRHGGALSGRDLRLRRAHRAGRQLSGFRVVRRRPVLIDSPTSKSARNLERIARRVLALATARTEAKPLRAGTAGRRRSSTCTSSCSPILVPPTKRCVARTSDSGISISPEAWRSRRYSGLTTFERSKHASKKLTTRCSIRSGAEPTTSPRSPTKETRSAEKASKLDSALEAERAMLRQELVRELNAETEFTGKLLVQGARVPGNRDRRNRRAHQDQLRAPQSHRSRGLRNVARAGLRPGLRATARQVPEARSRAGLPNVSPAHAPVCVAASGGETSA